MRKTLDRMKSDENNGFLCVELDKDEPLLIYGREQDANYQRLEAIMTPCNYIHDYVGYENDTIADECIYDAEKQFEYLGAIQFVLLYNSFLFNEEKYGDERFEGISMIKT